MASRLVRPRAKPAAQPALRAATAASATLGSEVARAIQEITSMTAETIHRAAAFAWSARAMAGYRLCAAEPAREEAFRYFCLGEHYRETALVHATLGDDWRNLHAEVEHALAQDRAAALEVVGSELVSFSGRPRPLPRRAADATGPA